MQIFIVLRFAADDNNDHDNDECTTRYMYVYVGRLNQTKIKMKKQKIREELTSAPINVI